MFEFMWECMIISSKALFGAIFWSIGIGLFSFGIGILVFALSGEWKTKKHWDKRKKKYKGQPIVLEGGKEDE
jgi:hypothetical protein